MSDIAEKVKDKLKGTKDKVTGAAKEGAASSSSTDEQEKEFEEGAAGTEIARKEDPLKEYREKEPRTPAKEAEHEPTAVKRSTQGTITAVCL